MQIEGEMRGQVDLKRFQLPGVTLVETCPCCGRDVKRDFGEQDYLPYPIANQPMDLHMYCAACSNEWTVRVKLVVRLESAEAPA